MSQSCEVETIWFITETNTHHDIRKPRQQKLFLDAANTSEEANRALGDRMCSCCGSQLVSSLNIDEHNRGITLAVTDTFEEIADGELFRIEQVKIGDTCFNFKLRTGF